MISYFFSVSRKRALLPPTTTDKRKPIFNKVYKTSMENFNFPRAFRNVSKCNFNILQLHYKSGIIESLTQKFYKFHSSVSTHLLSKQVVRSETQFKFVNSPWFCRCSDYCTFSLWVYTQCSLFKEHLYSNETDNYVFENNNGLYIVIMQVHIWYIWQIINQYSKHQTKQTTNRQIRK